MDAIFFFQSFGVIFDAIGAFGNVGAPALECGDDFSAGWNDRRTRAEISPHEGDRDITGCEFRLALVELNLADLKCLALCLGDCLKIHVVGREKDNGDIETLGRVRRIDLCLNRLQIAVTALLQNEIQLPRIFDCLRVAVSLPIQRKRPRKFIFVAGSAKQRLKR